MKKAANSLTDTYLTCDSDGCFSFSHESLKENVEEVYINVNLPHALKLLKSEQVITHDKKTSGKCIAKLPENKLAVELTKELLDGNIQSVSKLTPWRDQTFVDAWLRYIGTTCDAGSIHRCILENLLVKQSLLNSLLKHNMKLAVMSLLQNEYIQHELCDSNTWFKGLEDALVIVCRTTCDIDILRAIIKFPTTKRLGNLNGSLALYFALTASSTECAVFFVKESKVTLEFDYKRIFNIDVFSRICDFGIIEYQYYIHQMPYFYQLCKSTVSIADFQLIFDLLIEKGMDINGEVDINPLYYIVSNIAELKPGLDRLTYVIERGVDINKRIGRNMENIVSFSLQKLLSVASLKVLPVLYENNADFKCVNEDGSNAFHILCSKPADKEYEKLFNYLLDIGIDASHSNNKGIVPLMCALKNNPGLDCLKILMKYSPLKHVDKLGRGYFHYILSSKCDQEHIKACCTILSEAGEDVNLKDNE